MADDNKEGVDFNEALRRIANNPTKRVVPALEKKSATKKKDLPEKSKA